MLVKSCSTTPCAADVSKNLRWDTSIKLTYPLINAASETTEDCTLDGFLTSSGAITVIYQYTIHDIMKWFILHGLNNCDNNVLYISP